MTPVFYPKETVKENNLKNKDASDMKKPKLAATTNSLQQDVYFNKTIQAHRFI